MRNTVKKEQTISSKTVLASVKIVIVIAVVFAITLLIKSSVDFSRTGPAIRKEVLDNYKLYIVYAMARLSLWTFVLTALSTMIGVICYWACIVIMNRQFRWVLATVAGLASFGLTTLFLFCRHLLYLPSSISETSLYRISRFYGLWDLLTPNLLFKVQYLLIFCLLMLLVICGYKLIVKSDWFSLLYIHGSAGCIVLLVMWAVWLPEPSPANMSNSSKYKLPNIVMIGSDSLRADRLGISGYNRNLTPFIDSLASSGVYFKNCYVPMARTAPSLTSLLTGSWPHTHGVRDNYIGDDQRELPVETLPNILRQIGYQTGVISDWAGADLGKLHFGFDYVDTAPDQWNLKYLLRQGPKDFRLFLTLFTHNKFGKKFLPEIYYMAGIPLTSDLGSYSRRKINEWSAGEKPFFLMIFSSATHAPFGSQYPYYTMYADKHYKGESKFTMAGLTTAEEVVAKQAKGKDAFDVNQIVNLYDGAVKSFDDEVSKIVKYINSSGLKDNTIIVIYSDHGFDLFERNAWGQGNQVSGVDYSARIPLIMTLPFNNKSIKIENPVRSIDIAPTLLNIVGANKKIKSDGTSLLSYIQGKEDDLELPIYVETGIWLNKIPGFKKDHLTYPPIIELLEIKDKSSGTLSVKPHLENLAIMSKDRMVEDENWKMVYFPMKYGAKFNLYNLIDDPQCNIDVSTKHPEQFNNLKNALVTWMKGDKKRKWDGNYLIPN